MDGDRRYCSTWTMHLLILLLSICTPGTSAGSSSKRASTPIASGLPLRVLPIGDSITYGAPVQPFNGYRKELHQMLVDRGNSVDFVGSVPAGDFSDNQNEGHRGKIIDEISDMSGVGIYAGANIVLLHAGTNDMNFDIDPAGAPDRLSKLIGYIYEHSPNAAVFVAQVIPSTTPSILGRIQTFNKAVPGVVNAWLKKGKHVTLVDMFDVVDKNTDLYDNLHPNTDGYSIMAHTWYDAIVSADSKGWIGEPGVYASPPNDCKPSPAWVRKGVLAEGARVAYTDGDFKQSWEKVGVFSKGACAPERLFFPDLDGDGFKDWACVDNEDGKVAGFLQKPVNGRPTNNWDKLGTIAAGEPGRKSSGVFFADLNGDGKDDYIYVDGSSGDVNAWINGGLVNNTWQWTPLGKINGNDVGATPENLQMADIDGDGKADFLIVNNKTGEVTAWLNGGPHQLPDYTKIGLVATGASKSVEDKIIIGSFTGSGRADYMLVGTDGKVTGFANRRQNSSLIPEWALKVTVADGPDNAEGRFVRMVDIDGDGKVDYVLLDKNGGSQLWLNKGTGGRWQIGDGVFLTDLDGDGVGDYVWVDKSVNAWGYINAGAGENVWQPAGQIAFSKGDGDLHQVRMAPLTNTGRSDIILVDDDVGGCLWAQNLGKTNGAAGFAFADFGPLATGPRHTVVADPYNWKWDSKRVTFADLTGDGLADYLYVNVDGAVLMWKNLGTNPPSWGLPHLVADGPSVGVWWTEIQFADVNHDGREDYIHVDRFTGRSEVWWNNGVQPDGSIVWSLPMSFAAGVGSTGYSVRIADMTGDGRSDFVVLDPVTGGAQLVDNQCWSTSGDGSGGSPPGSSQPAGITEVFTDGQGDTFTTTLLTGGPITTPIITTDSKGSTHTFIPSSVVETFTDGEGHTFKTTLPPGSTITTPITVISDGSTLKLTPSTSGSAPLITPPPPGSPGSIPDGIPPKSAPSPHVEITISGNTFYLPKTQSISILQGDGSPLTLFPSSIIAGSDTVTLTSISKATTLVSGDGSVTVSARPGDVSHPSSGGASGFGGLINMLKSLAGSATTIAGELESISEQGVQWAAGSVSNDGFSSGVSGLMDSTIDDLDSFVKGLSGAFDTYNDEIYELTDDGLRRVFESRIGSVEAFDILKSLRNLIKNLKTLKGSTIISMKAYWKQGALAAAVLAAAEEALRKFGNYPWAGEVPVPPKSSSVSRTVSQTTNHPDRSSSSTASASATPTFYLLSSKEGTDSATFKNYVNQLDDGQGYLIEYPYIPWQSYSTKITAAQAKEASLQSFMFFVGEITENGYQEFQAHLTNDARDDTVPEPQGRDALLARAKGSKHHAHSLPKRYPEFAPDKASHLKLISEFKSDKGRPNADFDSYSFDDSLGAGSTIYILDSGYTPEAPDFVNKNPETLRTYVVPNRLTLKRVYEDHHAPEDPRDWPPTFHGTGVASIAAGDVHGVAPKATLVVVKMRNAAGDRSSRPPQMRPLEFDAMVDAWTWVLSDVNAQQREAVRLNKPTPRFIINFSYGGDSLDGAPIWRRYLALSARLDIVVVVAAGNAGGKLENNPPGLQHGMPQALGRQSNPLITVGGTDQDGNLWTGTTPDLGQGGSITTYAQGYQVSRASGNATLNYELISDGTSYAAPAVAGLAAYFFGIESLAGQWGSGTAAKDMKDYIISKHWERQEDPIASSVPRVPFPYFHPPAAGSVKVAWNALEEGLCNVGSHNKRLAVRQSDGDKPIVSKGTTASEFAHACPATSSSAPTSSTPTSSTPTSLPPLRVSSGYYKECGGTSPCGDDDEGLIQDAVWISDASKSYNPCAENESPAWEGPLSTSPARSPDQVQIIWGAFAMRNHPKCTVEVQAPNLYNYLVCEDGRYIKCAFSEASTQQCDTGDSWKELSVCVTDLEFDQPE